jgi:hypothetical protein
VVIPSIEDIDWMKLPNWNKVFDERVISSKREGGGKTNAVWHIKTE